MNKLKYELKPIKNSIIRILLDVEWGDLGATRKQKKVTLLIQHLISHQNKLHEYYEDGEESIANKVMERSE